MVYLDLDELPRLTSRGGLIATRALATATFLRRDHFKHWAGSLKEAVSQCVLSQTGIQVTGPIRLLTQLRYFGFYFSPLNLYYCYSPDGTKIEAIVAEVNNTPWNEQHHYVLWSGNRSSSEEPFRFVHKKAFHVSPFMEMDFDYHWHLSPPADQLGVTLANVRQRDSVFQACLNLQKLPLTRYQLARSMFRFPLMTQRIMAAIYFQAARIWIKKCPFYPHPKTLTASPKPPTQINMPNR